MDLFFDCLTPSTFPFPELTIVPLALLFALFLVPYFWIDEEGPSETMKRERTFWKPKKGPMDHR
jgi:hypothetical protein